MMGPDAELRSWELRERGTHAATRVTLSASACVGTSSAVQQPRPYQSVRVNVLSRGPCPLPTVFDSFSVNCRVVEVVKERVDSR